jgi:transcription-repair coupling factor (superfamily II helicase)
VRNLLAVAAFRQRCRAQGVAEVALAGNNIRIAPVDLPDSAQLRLRRLHPKAQYKPATKLVTVPRPVEGGRMGGAPLRDVELLDWCAALISDVLVPVAAAR